MSLQLHNDYKYITMIHDHDLPKTSVFDVYTKNEKETYLGEIRWYAPWRQYCFYPQDECVFSKGCMNDICDFINRLGELRKQTTSLNKSENKND